MKCVNLEAAVEVLREGRILIYPTETFYGLGVDIFQPEAIDRLFELKGREASKAVSVLVASVSDAEALVDSWDPLTRRLAERFWPGPLTLVLPASNRVPSRLTGGNSWIGIRVSSHPLTGELLRYFGGAITTTSANPSAEPSATRVAQLEKYFGERSDLFLLEGGDLPDSKGSTVLKVEAGELKPLREGEIPITKIQRAISSLETI